MLTQPDFKNRKGEWVQRAYIGKKYVWTTSGVLWNNIKERCTVGGATQTREPTYVGCTNKFTDFQDFTDWHVRQIGYAMGYQLDADILNSGDKFYSKDTCLLIPPALNKFLQTYKGKRGLWPQGMHKLSSKKKLCCRIDTRNGGYENLGVYFPEDVDIAREQYRRAKNRAAKEWFSELESGTFPVDPRVVTFMETWEHICDWTPP